MDEPILAADVVNILIVDDEPESLVALEAVLQGLGQNIVTARSGDAALRHLLTKEFAVILLDVQMPDLDGFEVANLIRQREKTSHTPIVFLTGAESEAKLIRGYAVGAVDYLLKPVVPEVLTTKISVFVELARRTQIIERQAQLLRDSHLATLGLVEIRARLLEEIEASMALVASLDFQATLERVAALTVPRFAEWCVIDLMGDDGRIQRAGSKHRDPAQERLMRTLCELPALDLESDHPCARVLRTGRSELLAGCPPELLDARCPRAEASLFKSLGTTSLIAVPFATRGRTVGALLLGRAGPAAYGSPDLTLAEEFAGRAAIAIENARLYREAQAAISLRDNFLNIASHELRTPLTSMRLQVDALLRDLGRTPRESQDLGVVAKVEMVQRQTGRLERLIEELLDASRIAADRMQLRLEEVDVAALVRDVCARAPEELGAGEVPITVRAARPVVGFWDRLHLEEVLNNLLANAIKYGSGKPIEVCVEASSKRARLIVRDHGIGIAPGDHERIFGRFERASSEQHYSGFGLGLWIARQIVEGMSGTIMVESALGAGSTFVVDLPKGLDDRPEGRSNNAELATKVRRTRADSAQPSQT